MGGPDLQEVDCLVPVSFGRSVCSCACSVFGNEDEGIRACGGINRRISYGANLMKHATLSILLGAGAVAIPLAWPCAAGASCPQVKNAAPAPLAIGPWTEDYDGYDTVQRLPDQSTWESWDNDPYASDFYATTSQWRSPPNSMVIEVEDSAVHRYYGYTIGKWKYTAWVFAPLGWNQKQYFGLLNTYPVGPSNPEYWSLAIEIDGAGGNFRDLPSGKTLKLNDGFWNEIMVYIDLDRDLQTVYINGDHLISKSWRAGVAPGGDKNIAAVNMYGNLTVDPLYYDDLVIEPAGLGMMSFSIDFQSPTKSVPDACSAFPITEGDLLLPALPYFPVGGCVGPPCISAWAGPGSPPTVNPGPDLGLSNWAAATTMPWGVPGLVEVDALSYGRDYNWDSAFGPSGLWCFSVDEWAWGDPTLPQSGVTMEGMAGIAEASADSYVDDLIGAGPYGPGPVFPNKMLFDGDGSTLPGIFLREPNVPNWGSFDNGDNMDAMDIDEPVAPQYAPFPVYFSLDGFYVDSLEGPPVNSGSAGAESFVGGDVLMTATPGAAPVVYAHASQLGLDLIGGPDSDDLDALAIWENGQAGYQPSLSPHDWIGGATDMLLFSVRRDSAVCGQLDSLWGAPIEEGDILCPPVAGGGPNPGIFIPAEMLGLGTKRNNTQNPATGYADDLDALDVAYDCNINQQPDVYDIMINVLQDCNSNYFPDTWDVLLGFSPDCNANMVPDECDIANGTSTDCDLDGVPDECQNPRPCPYDVTHDCMVDVDDVFAILGAWGPCPGCPEDVNGDAQVNIDDLFGVLANWGPCS